MLASSVHLEPFEDQISIREKDIFNKTAIPKVTLHHSIYIFVCVCVCDNRQQDLLPFMPFSIVLKVMFTSVTPITLLLLNPVTLKRKRWSVLLEPPKCFETPQWLRQRRHALFIQQRVQATLKKNTRTHTIVPSIHWNIHRFSKLTVLLVSYQRSSKQTHSSKALMRSSVEPDDTRWDKLKKRRNSMSQLAKEYDWFVRVKCMTIDSHVRDLSLGNIFIITGAAVSVITWPDRLEVKKEKIVGKNKSDPLSGQQSSRTDNQTYSMIKNSLKNLSQTNRD